MSLRQRKGAVASAMSGLTSASTTIGRFPCSRSTLVGGRFATVQDETPSVPLMPVLCGAGFVSLKRLLSNIRATQYPSCATHNSRMSGVDSCKFNIQVLWTINYS